MVNQINFVCTMYFEYSHYRALRATYSSQIVRVLS